MQIIQADWQLQNHPTIVAYKHCYIKLFAFLCVLQGFIVKYLMKITIANKLTNLTLHH